MSNSTSFVNVRVPRKLVRAVEAEARRRGITRSEFVREAIIKLLGLLVARGEGNS